MKVPPIILGRILAGFILALTIPFAVWGQEGVVVSYDGYAGFEAAHEPHSGAVMLLHYPPITKSLLPGQLRSGAHTDFGTMTLLFHHGSAEGLEIQRPDGSWLHAPSIPGCGYR